MNSNLVNLAVESPQPFGNGMNILSKISMLGIRQMMMLPLSVAMLFSIQSILLTTCFGQKILGQEKKRQTIVKGLDLSDLESGEEQKKRAEDKAKKTIPPVPKISAEELKKKRQEALEKSRLVRIKYNSEVLEKYNIPATREGLFKFFKNYEPSVDVLEQVKGLVKLLGSNSYQQREKALAEILSIPNVPTAPLIEAINSNDREIAWRAKSALEQTRQSQKKLLRSAIQLVELKKEKGFVRQLYLVAPVLGEDNSALGILKSAMGVTCSPADKDLLMKVVQNEEATEEFKILAVWGLYNAVGKSASPTFMKIADSVDESPRVRVESLYALSRLGNPNVVDNFVSLLACDDLESRGKSARALRALTGQNFRYAPYDADENRKVAIKKWADWAAKNKDFKLLELEAYAGTNSYLNGNTLIAYGYKNLVVEYGPGNAEVWRYAAEGAWSAEKLSNGNVLIAEYRKNRVIEVNKDKKVVWEMAAAGVLNARPLQNGNFLISLFSGRKAIEVNRDKKIVWEFVASGSVADAIRLGDGTTVVAGGNKIVAVDSEKKQLWEYKASQPYGINVTPTGTILICSLNGEVVEYDPATKKKIWSFKDTNLCDASRLENGNTMIVTRTHAKEITPEGKEVWRKSGFEYGTVRR